MKFPTRSLSWLMAAALLVTAFPFTGLAKGKSYSNGSRSYSSSSSSRSSGSSGSRSSNFGSSRSSSGGSRSSSSGSKSYQSGSGKSYSSGSSWKDDNRHSYSSGKSYSSGSGHLFSSGSGSDGEDRGSRPAPSPSVREKHRSRPTASVFKDNSDDDRFTFDAAAARARQEEVSRRDLQRFKETQATPSVVPDTANRPPLVDAPPPAPSVRKDSSPLPAVSTPKNTSADDRFTFDAAAARARQEEASRRDFQRFKEAQAAPPVVSDTASRPSSAGAPSYQVKPPPLPTRRDNSCGRTVYVPDTDILVTRPSRGRIVFEPYYDRPVVVYHDPYSNLFWWWLLDRSLEDRAWWTYHHRYDMDPARYQALVDNDRQLEARVQQLEAQQIPRDSNYTPASLDRDLMYSDHYVSRAYDNRPTSFGVLAFWALVVPMALAVCGLFIWLIWFKRWQTAAT